MEKHTFTFSDGSEQVAELNGNNYIFDTPVAASLLTDISAIKIDGEAIPYDKVVNHFTEDGKDHIIFGNKTHLDTLLSRVADTENAIAAMIGGEVNA